MHRRSQFVSMAICAGVLLMASTAGAQLGSWQLLAPLQDPRTTSGVEGAAASLIGGQIYVSHGHRFGDTSFLSIYDIGTDTWTHGGATAPDAPSSPQSEMGAGTALGRHYAIGGRNGPTGEVTEFDPGTSTWTVMAPIPTARGGMGVASWNNLIYVIGGRTGGTFGVAPILSAVEVFNPSTNSWAALAPLPTAVSDNYATTATNGRIYVFGGVDGAGTVVSNVQIYDIATNTWSAGAPMPTARGAAMAGVTGQNIAVFGGYDGSTNLAVTELYDPAADSWQVGASMVQAASEIGQGMVSDGFRVYSIGSGIFGASDPVVQVYTGPLPPAPIPTVGRAGVAILILLTALAALAVIRRVHL